MEHINAPCGMWGMTSNVVSCWESRGLMGESGSTYQEKECSVRRGDKGEFIYIIYGESRERVNVSGRRLMINR